MLRSVLSVTKKVRNLYPLKDAAPREIGLVQQIRARHPRCISPAISVRAMVKFALAGHPQTQLGAPRAGAPMELMQSERDAVIPIH